LWTVGSSRTWKPRSSATSKNSITANSADKEKFAEIYWLFSREAVAGGSLEKYAETLPKKRGAVQRGLFKGGYQSIDEAF
jgi:hypothetical protein